MMCVFICDVTNFKFVGKLQIIPNGITLHSTLFVNIAKELLKERVLLLCVFRTYCNYKMIIRIIILMHIFILENYEKVFKYCGCNSLVCCM